MSFYQKFLIRTPLTGALEFARCLLESEVYSGNLDDGDLTDYEEKTFNVWETDLVEDAYHDDKSKLHLFWTTDYGSDIPKYIPHDVIGQIPSSVGGMEGHTGSPAQIAFIEGVWSTPHGAVMFDDNLGGPADKHQVLMEEIGHGLGAGTADDHTLRIGECYSGGTCYTGADQDQTPENVTRYNDGKWPVMGDARYVGPQRTAFSIEELLTIDFNDIPSVDE
ncbi:hypothetical protein Huta_2654 [Halorhabdus utahensis DSM 12940]|uniref:Uncharacterized protein n=2 Tax=Halorhabdus utahensis TaxID=146826 RepID=C7NQ89_HALUD|nr:hypothetical protein Huta_2654 [Halorhabdus utahensis DSM 12940]